MKTTKFKNLFTGDIFRFVGENTNYMVCYSKLCIPGNDIIQNLEDPANFKKIDDSMMDREVVHYSVNDIDISLSPNTKGIKFSSKK